MYSPEDTSRIEFLRHAAQTRSLTMEEQREVVEILREGRKSVAAAVSRSKTAKAKPDGAAVLANLMALVQQKGAS